MCHVTNFRCIYFPGAQPQSQTSVSAPPMPPKITTQQFQQMSPQEQKQYFLQRQRYQQWYFHQQQRQQQQQLAQQQMANKKRGYVVFCVCVYPSITFFHIQIQRAWPQRCVSVILGNSFRQ